MFAKQTYCLVAPNHIDKAMAASFVHDLGFDHQPTRLHSHNNLSLPGTTFLSWDHPHLITPHQMAITPDIQGDWKAVSTVHDIIKTISFVEGFGNESLVINPSPPTCHRWDHRSISEALHDNNRLAQTFRPGSVIVINFYARAECIGNLFDIRFIPTEWTVIAQSDAGFIVRNVLILQVLTASQTWKL
jgi:hypothetical protein